MNKDKIALKSGYYFMIFDKNEIPFFNDLKNTNRVIIKDNNTYEMYEAPNWDIAQRVDAYMDQYNDVGFEIDEYEINKDIKI